MIARCPRCAHEQCTFSDPQKATVLYCRWCGRTSKIRSWVFREGSIHAPVPAAVFIRASEIPRGNFAKEETIKITYPLDEKFEAASCKDILRWEAKYCKTGASE